MSKKKTRRNILKYDSGLKEKARKLRNNSTLAEVLLWRHLKGKQMLGFDFDRQKPIDRFIVDFFCYDLMLAIEIDGYSHRIESVGIADRQRHARLESLGIRFLRFQESDVRSNMDWVLSVIQSWIENQKVEPTPFIPLRGGDRTGDRWWCK